jgi:hypothetical protein
MMNANEVKAVVVAYWRYSRQCPLVAIEGWCDLETYGELADVQVVTKERYLIETEIKVTLSDLKSDIKKNKHRWFKEAGCSRLKKTQYFYFAVPIELANQAKPIIDDMYPYAGLLGCEMYRHTNESRIADIYRNPRLLKADKLDIKTMLRMVRLQSATICRLSKDLVEAQQKNGSNHQEI